MKGGEGGSVILISLFLHPCLVKKKEAGKKGYHKVLISSRFIIKKKIFPHFFISPF
jgi:hypothetical protein